MKKNYKFPARLADKVRSYDPNSGRQRYLMACEISHKFGAYRQNADDMLERIETGRTQPEDSAGQAAYFHHVAQQCAFAGYLLGSTNVPRDHVLLLLDHMRTGVVANKELTEWLDDLGKSKGGKQFLVRSDATWNDFMINVHNMPRSTPTFVWPIPLTLYDGA